MTFWPSTLSCALSVPGWSAAAAVEPAVTGGAAGVGVAVADGGVAPVDLAALGAWVEPPPLAPGAALPSSTTGIGWSEPSNFACSAVACLDAAGPALSHSSSACLDG